MTEIEQKELLALGTGPKLDYDRSKTFVDVFREQVARTPDAVAVVDCDSKISYKELDEQSDAWAHWLIDEKDVKPNDFVAVMLPRRKEFVVAVLGIWKAGAAYVPIDPAYPEERKQFMIADCEAKVVIDIETIASTTTISHSSFFIPHLAKPTGPAYVIYTSGSTGHPKGATVGHRAFANFTAWANGCLKQRAASRHLVYASFSFDISVIEMLCPLAVGGEAHILSEEVRTDLTAVADYVNERKINGATFPTSVGMELLNDFDLDLEYAVLAGEKMYPIRNSKTRVFNDYGPCEFCAGSTVYEVRGGETEIPIGRPFPNCCAKICDADGQLIPRGQVGELYLSGAHLGMGYIKRPELNREKYVAGWYRTGDLCRWNDEGQLEYIGRIDNQVKLRGFRVELGEVESAAQKLEGVRQAVAVVKDDRLVLYYTGEKIANANFAAHYSELPDYMVPSVFVRLEAMPLTSNGKIDRRHLPEPDISAEAIVAPRNLREQELTDLIRESAKLMSFGVTTNLISVGLTSLSAMRAIVKVNRKYGVSVRMANFMANPTVEGLAALLGTDAETDPGRGQGESLREYYPLTANQLGVYLVWEKRRDGIQYNLPCVFRFRGVDAETLRTALTSVVNAHPVLKMRLAHVDGEIVQHREDSRVIEATVGDLPNIPEAEIRSFFQSRVRPFDLFGENLCRLEVYRAGADSYLFKDFYHIVSDGLSEGLFLSELLSALKGGTVIAETYTAFDYALEAERYRETEAFAQDGAYFERLLEGLEATSYPNSPDANGTGKLREVGISIAKGAVDAKCAHDGVTASSFILHALMQVLASLTHDKKVLITSVSNGRGHAQLADCQGFFVKTLPVVGAESAAALQRQLFESIRHEEYPLTEMAERFGIRPQVLYAYQGELFEGTTQGVEVFPLNLETPQFPLLVTAAPKGSEDYEIVLSYDDGKYSEGDMKMLLQCLSNMAVSGRLLGEQEERELIALGTGEKLEYDRSETAVDLFQQTVAQSSDATAVVDCCGSLTYRELDALSDVLANRLIEKGVKPNDFVAVMLPRRKEFVVAVFGIWKAGAAYVPIDPEYPEERRRFMIADCEAKVVIDEKFVDEIRSKKEEGRSAESSTSHFLLLTSHLAKPSGLAYMIYTSGSTGTPKGTMISHSNLANFVHSITALLKLTASDRISCSRSFSFDAHIEDIFPILTVGGSSHIMPEEIIREPDLIRKFLLDHCITGGSYATQMGRILFQAYDDLPMRVATVGGEALSTMRGNLPIVNMYGPTECTVDSSYHILEPGPHPGNVPIGRPLPNTFAFILDRQGNLLPRGTVGELCIAGAQVGRGYWNRPELTAEKFVAMPTGWRLEVEGGTKDVSSSTAQPSTSSLQPSLMYRTGDLVRWNEEGQLEYIGRIDNQVKLRGYRVELGEIESAMMKFPGVSAAVASIRTVNGSEVLVGYYVASWARLSQSRRDGVVDSASDADETSASTEIDESALKSFLTKLLPEYMVPSAFVRLDAMPMTPSGKIDRKRLPEPEVSAEEMVAPRNLRELELTNLIRETVGLKSFGATSNLISVGLTSLSAMRLIVQVNRKYGVSVRMAEFMANPTVEGLAALLESDSEMDANFGRIQALREYYPLTANQLGIYLEWEKCRDGIQYNLPFVFRFRNVDAETLRTALTTVVGAHPVLKMRLARVDGEIVQHRDDSRVIEVTVGDLPNMPETEIRSFFQGRVRPFDLFGENLCRLEIYRTGTDCYLFNDFHHIASDGLSEGLFLNELLAALKGGTVVAETYTAFDYALEAERYRETEAFAQDGAYFERLLEGFEATSYPNSPEANGTGKPREVGISIRKDAIDAKCAHEGVTVSSLILHAVMQTLESLTHENKVLIASVSNGRGHAQLANCQGFFVKTLPVVGAESAAALQRQLFESVKHEEYPLTEMAERFGIRPQVLYDYQGELAEVTIQGVDMFPLNLETPQFPLLVTAAPKNAENYEITLTYDDAKYSEGAMKTLLRCLSNMVVSGMLLSEKEEQELLALGTGEKLEYDTSATVVDLFQRSVAQCPDATAVVDDQGSLTYRELDALSDVLANRLIEKGVKPNDFVAVMLPRRKEFLVATLGIWKAGAAYVPIDPEYPEERRRFMIEDCEAKVVIDEKFVDEIRSKKEEGRSAESSTSHFLLLTSHLAKPSGLAYMIYTSGSTGTPKGVMIGHRGLVNYIHATARINGLKRGDRISAHRSFSFDSHIEEFYPTLFVGGTVYIMPEEIRRDLGLIYKFLVENKIDACYFTTSMAVLMYQNYDLPVRFIGAVGEKLSGVIGGKNGVRFLNAYGPTECTDHISTFWLEAGRTYSNIPIGRPLPNGVVLITDAAGRLVPRGTAGELCFASPQLAKGYWKHPELTAEKFVPMYRTGDLARWNDEGQLEYLGRIDDQVKVRGIRIELGEIESNASQVEGLRQVAATVKNDSIVLYWCGESSESDIRCFLSGHLPEYMVPSVYMHLDAMPRTPSGKIDRKRLPEPVATPSEHIPPATAKERLVLEKVREILGVDDVGVTDDLMRLGLNSIRAMKLAFGLPPEWGVKVSDVMGAGTIRGMLAEQHDILWFHEKYDPSKRTVAVLHGVIGLDKLSALKEELTKAFNVLTVENIQDTLLSGTDVNVLVSPDGYDEFIRLYVRRMRELLPAGGEISLMIGFSFGGMMAYDTACAWKELTGQAPVVVMGDSYLNVSTDAHDYTAPDATYEQWRADIRGLRGHADALCRSDFWSELRLAICGNKRSVSTYSGRVILFRALYGNGNRVGHNIGLKLKGSVWYRLALWIYVHFHIMDFLASKRLAHIGILESGHRREISDNLSAWKHKKPDLEVHDVDTTHDDLYSDRDLLPRLVKLVRNAL